MNIFELARRRSLEDRRLLLNRTSMGGANLQFTWLNFSQGQNQQDSNGNLMVAIPPVPLNLVATPGNNQVSLQWDDSAGATSYNVYRSLVNGGPYAFLASNPTSDYVDLTAVNGTTYYYVVTAVNIAGESGNSNQASATPVDPFDGNLVVIRSINNTTVVNPAGNFTITNTGDGVVLEIHANNCPLLTGLTCSANATLEIVDLDSLPAIQTLTFDSNPALTSFSLTNSASVIDISANACVNLTSFNIDDLVTVGNNLICTSGGLISVSAPLLTSVGNWMLFNTNPDLTLVDLPSLVSVGGLVYLQANPSLTAIDLSALVSCDTLYFDRDTSLIEFNLPELTTCSYISAFGCDVLVQFTVPLLTGLSAGIDAYDCPLLASTNFNSIASFGYFYFSPSGMQSLALPGMTNPLGQMTFSNSSLFNIFNAGGAPPVLSDTEYLFDGCNLDETSVDFILQAGVDGGVSAATIDLSGGTNAPPSVAGAANAVILAGLGNTVSTN